MSANELMENYDDIINSHYNNVAEEYGDLSSSTMLDEKIRLINDSWVVPNSYIFGSSVICVLCDQVKKLNGK